MDYKGGKIISRIKDHLDKHRISLKELTDQASIPMGYYTTKGDLQKLLNWLKLEYTTGELDESLRELEADKDGKVVVSVLKDQLFWSTAETWVSRLTWAKGKIFEPLESMLKSSEKYKKVEDIFGEYSPPNHGGIIFNDQFERCLNQCQAHLNVTDVRQLANDLDPMKTQKLSFYDFIYTYKRAMSGGGGVTNTHNHPHPHNQSMENPFENNIMGGEIKEESRLRTLGAIEEHTREPGGSIPTYYKEGQQVVGEREMRNLLQLPKFKLSTREVDLFLRYYEDGKGNTRFQAVMHDITNPPAIGTGTGAGAGTGTGVGTGTGTPSFASRPTGPIMPRGNPTTPTPTAPVQSIPQSRDTVGLGGTTISNERVVSALFDRLRGAINLGGHQLSSIFIQFDKDKNASLSLDEVFQALKLVLGHEVNTDQTKAIFSYFDIDQNGTISYNEFSIKFEIYTKKFSAQPEHWAYIYFNLIREHIRTSRASIHELLVGNKEGGRIFITPLQLRDFMSKMRIPCPPEDLTKMEKMLDHGGTGKLDYLMFCDLLGYVHIPLVIPAASPLTLPATLKDPWIYLGMLISLRNVNLKDELTRLDSNFTYLVSMRDFVSTMNRLSPKLSNVEIEELGKMFYKDNQVQYTMFCNKIEEYKDKSGGILKVMLEISNKLKSMGWHELERIFVGYERGGSKERLQETFATNNISVTSWEIEGLMKEFGGSTFDFKLFRERYMEMERHGLGSTPHSAHIGGPQPPAPTQSGAPPPTMSMMNLYQELKNYCTIKHSTLTQAFSDVRVYNGLISEYDFRTVINSIVRVTPDDLSYSINHLRAPSGEVNYQQLNAEFGEYYQLQSGNQHLVPINNKMFGYLINQINQKKVPVEAIVRRQDQFNKKYITKYDFIRVLQQDLQCLSVSGTAELEQFASQFEGRDGLLQYEAFIAKLNEEIGERKDESTMYSSLKSHLYSNKHDLGALLRAKDISNERALPEYEIINVIQSTNFQFNMTTLNKIISKLERNPKGNILYYELIQKVNNAQGHQDMTESSSVRSSLAQNTLTNPQQMLKEIYNSCITMNHKVGDMLQVADITSSNTVNINEFERIIGRLGTRFDRYEISNLAKAYDTGNNGNVQYRKFLQDLNAEADYRGKLEVTEGNRTNLGWASNIFDDIIMALFLRDIELFTYFNNYGVQAQSQSMTKQHFKQAINDLKIKIYGEELDQLSVDLDSQHTGNVQIKDLSTIINQKRKATLETYETKLFNKMKNIIDHRGINVHTIFGEFENTGKKAIAAIDFENNLKRVGIVLDENEWRYLIKKYDRFRNNKLEYQGLYDDLRMMGSGAHQMNPNVKEALEKLKHFVERYKTDVPTLMAEYDTKGNGVISVTNARHGLLTISPDLVPLDIDPLLYYLDSQDQGTLDYNKLINLIYQDNPEQLRNRENPEAKQLGTKIREYCLKHSIDLEIGLIHEDHEHTHYLSNQMIQKVFEESGLKLSRHQFATVLDEQKLPVDMKGQKDYCILLNKIFGYNRVAEREKQEMGSYLSPIDPQGGGGVSEDYIKRIQNAVKENPSQDLYQLLRSYDNVGNGYVLIEDLKHILGKYGVFLTQGEEGEMFNRFPPLRNNTVEYRPIYDTIMMTGPPRTAPGVGMAEGGQWGSQTQNVFASSMYPSESPQRSPRFRESGDPKWGKANEEEPFSSQGYIKNPEAVGRAETLGEINDGGSVPSLRALTDKEIYDAQEWLASIGRGVQETQRTVYQVFGQCDPNSTGRISLNAFRLILTDELKLQGVAESIEVLYLYLQEGRSAIELKRLYAGVNGEKFPQYRAQQLKAYENQIKKQIAADNLALKRLALHIHENKIAFKELFNGVTTGSLTERIFINHLDKIGFQFSEEELPSIRESLDPEKIGQVSVQEFRSQMDRYTPDSQSVKSVQMARENISSMDIKAKNTLGFINRKLKEERIPSEQLYLCLEPDQEGNIQREQFASGLQRVGMRIERDDLLYLFGVLDLNHNHLLSWNEFALYIEGADWKADAKIAGMELDRTLQLEIESLFRKFDLNGDNRISFEELHQALKTSNPYVEYDEVKRIMDHADKDKSGYIDWKEFYFVMESKIKEDLLKAEDEMADLRILFRESDLDANGSLSVDELQYIYIYIYIL